MNLYALVKPLGIVTYAVILVAVISGLLRWKLKVHRAIAIVAAVLGVLHAALVVRCYWPDVF